ncbi:MAG: hypothetical protein COX07_05790 [Bacteroidetes bacterium CG23_combo_of_CG06-09_8_20_14_all_32_9]|nr:MAG: hypothetical protein COX07_05790 [Bacteroidetes bacterium CG23_combo_of_CG06-09_8_20_14_all_32_9]
MKVNNYFCNLATFFYFCSLYYKILKLIIMKNLLLSFSAFALFTLNSYGQCSLTITSTCELLK